MIHIVEDNILNFKGDCIVNAANSDLLAGGGVCGAIFGACDGRLLQEKCNEIGHCDVGQAVITPSCGLKDVKYIIHAVAPRYGLEDDCEAKLYNAYYHALQLAYLNDIKSIAFPSLGTGIFCYPIKQASHIAIRAMKDFLHVFNDMEIYLYAFSHEDYMAYFIEDNLIKDKFTY